MATELVHRRLQTRGVEQHFVTMGAGPAVLLLHGWPQTWFEWRGIIPELAKHHTVVAPDLRGLGDSSRPSDGYDKQTIAEDVYSLMHELGHQRFAVIGHDWGGIIAYFLAASHPSAVSRLAVLDVMLPTAFKGLPLIMPGVNPAWHFAFHNVPGLPELLLEGREDAYLRWWFREGAARPEAVPEDAIQEYVRAYSQPGAMVAGLAYYRSVVQDVQRAELLGQNKLALPVLAAGGARSFGPMVERSLSQAAENVKGLLLAECGHWVTEERPKELTDALATFLAERSEEER